MTRYLLSSNSSGFGYLFFDMERGRQRRVLIWQLTRDEREKTRGWYQKIGGIFYTMLRTFDGRLLFTAGKRIFDLADVTWAEIVSDVGEGGKRRNLFRLFNGRYAVFELEYKPSLPWLVDPFAVDVDTELERDFLLFVANVVNNPSRKRRFGYYLSELPNE